MRIIPESPALRRWRLWLAALVAGEIGWFALLHPRNPEGVHTILVLALLPVAVVGYVYVMTGVSAYLAERHWDFRLRQLIVLILGLSVGCFVFALLWLAKVHFQREIV